VEGEVDREEQACDVESDGESKFIEDLTPTPSTWQKIILVYSTVKQNDNLEEKQFFFSFDDTL